MKSLATKWRPKVFEDVLGQEAVKTILQQQLESGTLPSAMLFCGPSGDGKTTTARIVANILNRGQGLPIEMDAASHNGVDDVREISRMATSQALDAPYKVFIIDECHSISNTGWQAMLKLIEEPPARAKFIFCTTDPQKIPATILSRVQRFQFQKVSTDDIANRLDYILSQEMTDEQTADRDAVEYLAKLAEGGVRLAIQYLEKCMAYSNDLTVENVVKALNITNYDDYIDLTDFIMTDNKKSMIQLLDEIYASGVDFKQFIKSYVQFILDVNKYIILSDSSDVFKYISIPKTDDNSKWLKAQNTVGNIEPFNQLLRMLVKLDADIKYSQNPKVDVEATMLMFEVKE